LGDCHHEKDCAACNIPNSPFTWDTLVGNRPCYQDNFANTYNLTPPSTTCSQEAGTKSGLVGSSALEGSNERKNSLPAELEKDFTGGYGNEEDDCGFLGGRRGEASNLIGEK